MSTCDIFVLPSHTEGFPNAVAEAMAQGRAVVATDVGAVPDMLDNGAGVVLPVGDIESLALAMKDLMEDEQRRLALGEAARIRSLSCYGMDSVFRSYVALWSALRDEGASQGREGKGEPSRSAGVPAAIRRIMVRLSPMRYYRRVMGVDG